MNVHVTRRADFSPTTMRTAKLQSAEKLTEPLADIGLMSDFPRVRIGDFEKVSTNAPNDRQTDC
jgi:hypothetical protein